MWYTVHCAVSGIAAPQIYEKAGQAMTKQQLIESISNISGVDREVMQAARQRQDSLAKPPGSLGQLEEIAVRMAGITGRVIPEEPERGRNCVIVFCADNGVVAQGVASAPQSVTRAQTMNFCRRLTGVGTLAKSFNSELLIVDMGVKDPIPEELYDEIPLRDTHKIIDRRIRPGTWDISEGPAMTEAEALQALSAGMEMVQAAANAGFRVLGIGEMGIGNTTTSAAVLSSITGAPAEVTCGRGGGVNDTGFRRKKEIVEQIRLELCKAEDDARRVGSEAVGKEAVGKEAVGREAVGKEAQCGNEGEASPVAERLNRIIRILARCGGFDLAAMTGAYLGAAKCRLPVVIDGYISVVAAVAAAEISPAAADYMIASHQSAEPGYLLAMQRLEQYSPTIHPFLGLDMRLGEGSGCPIAFEVIRGACAIMRNMATFEEAAINDDYLEEVRAGGCF